MHGRLLVHFIMGVLLIPALTALALAQPGTEKLAFSAFLEEIRTEARAAGVSEGVIQAALRGVSPDPRVAALTRKQSEFVRPIWAYLDSAVSPARLSQGRKMSQDWDRILTDIETRYGVPRAILLGIWGMETHFGGDKGSLSVIRSLATLAFLRYREDFFRKELIATLTILQEGATEGESMRGSWAGAMGHTQFMPTSFLRYAVDGDGDGRRDIWNSVPDALASTAHYLREKGWQPGGVWGFETKAPSGFDFRTERASLSRWATLGFTRADGHTFLTNESEAWLFAPGGAKGPLFLLTANYDTIKEYNLSDAYALAVAHLGDRILGAEPIRGHWPRNEKQLSKDQRISAQKSLARLGFYQGKTDGKIGSRTRAALRQFQLARGFTADGYLNAALLKALQDN
jgi:membrane-bound lytic murein transglycosylase B